MFCGTDIIEVARIKEAMLNEKFKERIFSTNEIIDIDSNVKDTKYQRYAGRFAAKEAIYKAISKILIDSQLTLEFNEIEIGNISELRRRPKVTIRNEKVNEIMMQYDIDVSISHIKECAIAMCIIAPL